VNRDPGVVLGQASQDLEAVEVGQHDVEHHEVRAKAGGRTQGVAAGMGHLDLQPLVAQGHRDQVGDADLVVHHQHACRFCHSLATSRAFILTCQPVEFL
jgi:hypothetical protein